MPLFNRTHAPEHTLSGLPPAFTIPAVPHPSPHSRLLIIPTPDGIVLVPATPGSERSEAAKISWGKDAKVIGVSADNLDKTDCATVPGIVGILRLFNASYLLVISDRMHVGSLVDESRSVYGIKDVIAVPLEEERAKAALQILLKRQAKESLMTQEEIDMDDNASILTDTGSVTDDDSASITEADAIVPSSLPEPIPPPPSAEPPSATFLKARQPDMARRLSFWRKVARRQKPLPEPIPPLAEELSPPPHPPPEMNPAAAATLAGVDGSSIKAGKKGTKTAAEMQQARLVDVERKAVRECIRLLTQGVMFFSYDFDITRGLQQKHTLVSRKQKQDSLLSEIAGPRSGDSLPIGGDALPEPNGHLPLWRRVDRKYWWNRHLISDFVDAGLHTYILPIMNGFVEMSQFHVPVPTLGDVLEDGATEVETPVPVDFIIFSRRSCERPGLRYQRRGIDDDANVANFVETETIVSLERDGKRNIFAYLQIRGSIPLFWSQPQPGLALKPLPRLDRPLQESSVALRRHFQKLSSYGTVTIVNLSETTGREAVVTLGYRDCVNELNLKDVRYQEFDFHHECKGMKYENISKLITALQSSFAAQGYFWINGNDVLSEQRGVCRTNCIDCLDRTNVVQSALSRHILDKQLQAVALLSVGGAGKTEQEIVFNTVWADNGDAISRSYAGTSALKGDFTRTGKRDINGMWNDGMNSLARLYSSAFADYFTQAIIDYTLGNRALSVFAEFLEKLQSTDPGEMLRLSKIRAAAIDTCASRILSEGENFLAGWTLFSPAELNAKMGKSFEEKILLLSTTAIYINSYDFALDKVVMFTRIPLGDILSIQKGTYILSVLQEAARDPAENYGLLISWRTAHETSRITSYSLRNKPEALDTDKANKAPGTIRPSISRAASSIGKAKGEDTQFAAFKALGSDAGGPERPRSLDVLPEQGTCKQAVDVIVDTIVRACRDAGYAKSKDFVVTHDIISLTEAQRETTVYAKLEYYLKRRLWL